MNPEIDFETANRLKRELLEAELSAQRALKEFSRYNRIARELEKQLYGEHIPHPYPLETKIYAKGNYGYVKKLFRPKE